MSAEARLTKGLKGLMTVVGTDGLALFCQWESQQGIAFPQSDAYLTSPSLPPTLQKPLLWNPVVHVFLGIAQEESSRNPHQGYQFLDRHQGHTRLLLFPYGGLHQTAITSPGHWRLPQLHVIVPLEADRHWIENDNAPAPFREEIQPLLPSFAQALRTYWRETHPLAAHRALIRPDNERQIESAIQQAQAHMCAGDCYLLNHTLRLEEGLEAIPFSPLAFLKRWLQAPTRFGVYFKSQDAGVMAFSPESFLTRRGQHVLSEPIKGTLSTAPATPTGEDAQRLWANEKERYEQTMVADLIRHDLNGVCIPGSVQVHQPFFCRVCGPLLQMQSAIHGQLPVKTSLGTLLRHTLPGGSITGTPKYKVSEIIERLEAQPRGFYTGIFGVASPTGNLDSTLLIRSLFTEKGRTYAGVGAGITALSDPQAEIAELRHKLDSFLCPLPLSWERKAVGTRERIPVEAPLEHDTPMTTTIPMAPVLFIDHQDSFTHNLLASLRSTGLPVCVLQSSDLPTHTTTLSALITRFSGLVLSPGPGHPQDYPRSLQLLQCLPDDFPLLGICLGFQLVLAQQGASIVRLGGIPRHGQRITLTPAVSSLVLPEFHYSGPVVLYNSLGCHGKDQALHRSPWQSLVTEDAFCLAAEDPKGLRVIVQFHPESFGTLCGPSLIHAWAKGMMANPK